MLNDRFMDVGAGRAWEIPGEQEGPVVTGGDAQKTARSIAD